MSKQKRIQLSSSSEEEDDYDYIAKINYQKSAVFNTKASTKPIFQDRAQSLDESKSEPEDQDFQLKPKLKPTKPQTIVNSSNVYQKSQTIEPRTGQRPLTAAYTFKLKSPTTTKKKRKDPVALFQETKDAWKKSKFLINRGNNKEGRKLQLSKRNKEFNTIV